MYMYTQGHSRIVGTGTYIPAERVTTQQLMEQIDSANRFGVSADWLEKVTGIREKRVTPEGFLPSDMAVAAAHEAMDRANTAARDIDVIVYCGLTRDYLEPATAHVVQAKLSASNAIVFDVTNACHGFMNGLHLMDAFIATGQARRGLVVTGEQGKLFAQKAIDALRESDEKQRLIELAAGLTLGDAGAAVLMGPKLGPDSGFMGFMLQSQGQHASYCTSGGPLAEGPLVTDMPAIVSESSKLLEAMFGDFMHKRLKWSAGDVRKFAVHQVGAKTFKLYSQGMGVPLAMISNTVATMGNVITATIPLNIHNFAVHSEIDRGDKIYLSGAGSGISVSQAGLIWDAA